MEYYEHALKIAKEVGDKASEKDIYYQLGIAYISLGDFGKGMEYYQHALQIIKEVGEKASEGKIYCILESDYRCLENIS